jgi:type IV pilus assembly protein PilC
MSNQVRNGKEKQAIALWAREFEWGGADIGQRVLFAKNLSVMIKSGLTVNEALRITADAAQGRFREVVLQVLASVEAGGALSDGLKKFPRVFSPLFVNAVYAGEASGTLEGNLVHVAEQMRKERELSQKVKGAMLYPCVVLAATFTVGIGIVFFILPKLTPIFEGLDVELPATTRLLLWVSRCAQEEGAALLGAVALCGAAFWWTVRQRFSHPGTHLLLLQAPVIGKLSCHSNLARSCRTLGTLLQSGVPIHEATALTASTATNFYYVRALQDVSQRMASGSMLADNLQLHEKLFPKFMIGMIRVGEQSGRLDEVLLYLAAYFEEEVDESAKSLSATIEPILLLVLGLLVGFLALSIITPIYSITGNLHT